MYAVIDCNNFYVSCERIFRPELEKIPVVVLSNNDGCIISRSNESKSIGVIMGSPAFENVTLFRQYNVQVFSSNFSLYADISSRVMQIIGIYAPTMEIYSIDEVFVDFNGFSVAQILKVCRLIKKQVQQCVGIPVSIGIGKTKTLAKAANEISKKNSLSKGVYGIGVEFPHGQSVDTVLESLNIEQIWGIGRKLKVILNNHNIYNAVQLKYCEDRWIRAMTSVSVLHTVFELREQRSVDFKEVAIPKKSIVSSRSFGKSVVSIKEMREAVAKYASRVGEKLREEREVASFLTLYIMTNYHNKGERFYTNTETFTFDQPTSYTPDLIEAAYILLDKIFMDGYNYKKASVLVTGLIDEKVIQHNLFKNTQNTSKEVKLMKMVDEVNNNFGSDSLHFASQGYRPRWAASSMKRSPRYTTNWHELYTIEI